ncbi:IPExxxVDY family protein [Thermaurantimonas aggregans]|uniref:IPExxxVDY family protein n=1 Tax=Thermaurantimonas aggregans TaxID=2173829 RepID=UPI0023F0D10E|nr:IPExxxVDY family protein [Thermaurantimonas aggregans]MCX8148338.1 IPExxxVDY family protein [Thermaurantimonas aggregans]
MKKHILTLDETQRSFQCFAIQTQLSDYELAFCINSALNIGLERITDHKLSKETEEFNFSAFMYDDEMRLTIWSLISNVSHPSMRQIKQNFQNVLFDELETSLRIYLVPDFKGIDYWLMIDCEDVDLSEEIKLLRNQHGISSIMKVDIHSFKHWSNLLLY